MSMLKQSPHGPSDIFKDASSGPGSQSWLDLNSEASVALPLAFDPNPRNGGTPVCLVSLEFKVHSVQMRCVTVSD